MPDHVQVTALGGQVVENSPTRRVAALGGQVVENSPIRRVAALGVQVAIGDPQGPVLEGRTIRDVYQNLDPKTESPRGSYSRRIAESLELDTTSRGSGSWDKIIVSQLDEEQTGPGSWRTRLLRFLRKSAEE